MSLSTRFTLQFGLAAGLGVSLALATSLGLFGARLDDMGRTLGNDLERAVSAQLRKGADGLLDRFSDIVKPALLDYDRTEIAALARAAVETSGVAALRVYDAQGRGVADAAEAGESFASTAPPPLVRLDATGQTARWVEGDLLFSGRRVCLGESCIGAVAVGIDRGEILSERAAFDRDMADAQSRFFGEAFLLGALALAAASGVAGAVGWLLGRRLTAGLRSAIAGLDQLAAGATAVRIDSKDAQLRELAEAVERVAESIAANPRSATTDAAVAEMSDGLFVARLDGAMVVANPALHALFGAPADAMVGADAYAAFAIPPAASLDAFAAAVSGVTSIVRRDGAATPIMISARVSRAGDAIEGRVVGVVRDATETVAAEARLAAAQARADAADRAKAEFLAVMSHELRTPLNGVLGGAAVLAGSDLSPSQRSFVDIVQNSGKSLLAMVGNILDLARLESGDAAPMAEPVDVEGVAHEILAVVSGSAEAKGVDLFLSVAPGAPMILADREKLRDVGVNLAANAIKFTEAGSVGIDIGVERVDGQARVRLSVEDTGVGIAPEKVGGIFEAFRQGDSSASRGHGGAGLGLALTKKLVDLMGGEITVESTPGKGSTFTVTFDAPIDAAADGAAAAPEAPLAGVRALVAAVDARERAALAAQLGHAGAHVETAASAVIAEAMLRDFVRLGTPVDLVVHPEALPDFDASGLALRLRGPAEPPATASVALAPANAAADDLRAIPGHVVTARRPPTGRELVEAAVEALGAIGRAPPAAAPEARAHAAADAAPAAESVTRAEMRVVEGGAVSTQAVLAETNEVNRIVLRSFLEKAGFTPHLASNGFEAVKLFKEVRPSLMLVATSMPTMTGTEAAKAIRRHELEINAQPATIIGLTEPGREGEHERCTAAGMNDSVAKPVRLDELAAKIERWTAPRRAPEEARSAAG